MTGLALARVVLAAGLAGEALASAAGGTIPCRLRKPDSWDVTIAGPGEPGPRLEVTGSVYSARDGKPLRGVTLYVYHADQRGRYGEGSERSDPRLCGVMLTNERGQYRFRTVMPGGPRLGAHIHYEVWPWSVASQSFLLTFGPEVGSDSAGYAGPRLLGGARDDPAATQRPLVRDSAGVLHVVRDLRVPGALGR